MHEALIGKEHLHKLFPEKEKELKHEEGLAQRLKYMPKKMFGE